MRHAFLRDEHLAHAGEKRSQNIDYRHGTICFTSVLATRNHYRRAGIALLRLKDDCHRIRPAWFLEGISVREPARLDKINAKIIRPARHLNNYSS